MAWSDQMPFFKRALLRFAAAFCAAGAGVCLFASPVLASSALQDVQVGERDLQTRIALICEGLCNLEKRSDDVFFLPGVSVEMALDLSDRSENVEGFSIRPDAEGSLLNISPNRLIEYANAKPCRIKERQAVCVDMFFADARPRQAMIETPSLSPEPEPEPAKPDLRESAKDRLSRFARLGPPERLEPPQGARLASVRSVNEPPRPETTRPETTSPERPSFRDSAHAQTAPAKAEFDYAASVKALLGKDLTPGFCASSKASLQTDPWALEDMVNVGLCEAADGNAPEAEQTLARLLQYTPDNYEAHVGRALIAIEAGEKSIARRYFQDALNAVPPIEESNRIVAAMNRL
ncbi:tetratricopeptide repeat protein [Hyphococcus sp.]|uniref:tetratricopeptide repeat protein n=1 Tax=Hyphococcus sp. TaxID=2038636 RepID=UPI003CCBD5A8